MRSAAATAVERTGLEALIHLRLREIAVDPARIRHEYGAGSFGIPEILRCAKQFPPKSPAISANREPLTKTSMPASAPGHDGSFVIHGNLIDDKTLIQEPGVDRPQLRAEFRGARERPAGVDLPPGMAVTVEIKSGQRRIIAYLLSPLLRYKQGSLREEVRLMWRSIGRGRLGDKPALEERDWRT